MPITVAISVHEKHPQLHGITMSHEITWETRGVYKRFTGFVSYDEYARTQEEILSDPRVDSIHYIINDFLEVDGYSVTRDQVEYLAAFNRGTSLSNPRIRIAYVVKTQAARLLVKAGSAISSLKLKDFSTLEAARAWTEGTGA